MAKTLLQRFESKWIGEPNSGCWIWTAAVNNMGYGSMLGPKPGPGNRMIYAHRFAYEAFVGRIPEGLFVLHRCDVPCCVNPDHLFLGTQKDNMRDASAKNRLPSGEEHVHGGKTHCPQGHAYDDDNTYSTIHPKTGVHRRHCRECRRQRAARRAMMSDGRRLASLLPSESKGGE